MSREVRANISYEMAQLRRLLVEYEGEMVLARSEPLTFPRVGSLGSMLHSFYGGVENVFKQIAVAIDGGLPDGTSWHAELLKRMAAPAGRRPAVINERLRADLEEYLGFRHVFRGHYAFELTWDRMKPLVEGVGSTLSEFDRQVEAFLGTLW